MNDCGLTKKIIRANVLAARDAMPREARERAAASVIHAIIASTPYRAAKTILAYAHFGSELNTHALLESILADGKKLILPRVDIASQQLQLHLVADLNELISGTWGIREPRANAEIIAPDQLDLIIVPGVAFDRTGFRIGYGKGFYDKLLANVNPISTRLSAAFDCQIIDAVPNEAHDQRVDIIITPTQKILIS